jgi:Uma2 family endonuclease
MSTTTTRLLSAEEFFQLPAPQDGSKRELVRGEVVTMPNPGLEHGEVQGNVYFAIKLFLKSNPLGRVFTESGLITDRKPDTVRGPDVSYYSKERLPLDKRVIGYHDQPADLCVEVVSPSNTKRELRAKIKEYFFAGVRMVWVVDPDERSITILRAPDEGRTLYDDTALDGGDVLPGFSCKVSDLFGPTLT